MTNETIRIDKWLWHTRLVKTRSLAARLCETGLVQINGTPCKKPAQTLRPGDRIQLSHAGWRREIEIAGVGTRRGPAAEAQNLYRVIEAIRPGKTEADWTPLIGTEDDEE